MWLLANTANLTTSKLSYLGEDKNTLGVCVQAFFLCCFLFISKKGYSFQRILKTNVVNL